MGDWAQHQEAEDQVIKQRIRHTSTRELKHWLENNHREANRAANELPLLYAEIIKESEWVKDEIDRRSREDE